MQNADLTRFSPLKPQRRVTASFEHHRGSHGLPAPHIHNVVTLPCHRIRVKASASSRTIRVTAC